MKRHKSRGTRGIIADAGSLGAEYKGEAPRSNRDRASGRLVDALTLPVHGREVGVHDAQENAHLGAQERLTFVARRVERCVPHFEEQALLWIHGCNLGVRDAKEARVKALHAMQECAMGRCLRQRAHVPSLRWHEAHGISACGEQTEGFGAGASPSSACAIEPWVCTSCCGA